MNYEQLLDKGMNELPDIARVKERYEIPKAKGHVEGNKTIIINFNQIVDSFRRDAQHFLKFILKELATPGKLEGGRLILGRVVSASIVNSKIKEYAEKYVLCHDCGKPDTKLENNYLKCTACGAKHPVTVI